MAHDDQPELDGYVLQIRELLAGAEAIDRGPAKVGILEEAVRIADSHNDTDLSFETRLELIQAATFGGLPDVAMVAFAWCIALADKEPERFESGRLLWMYKWVLDAAADYPQFGRDQIEDMLTDMARRYAEVGAGMHPVHQTAREVYRVLGDLQASADAHERTMQCDRDPLSNCPACEQHAQLKFYLDTNRTDLALKTAEPIFSGRMTCAEVPHVTYSYLLMPLALKGNTKLAAEYHHKGLKLIGTNPKFLSEAARHIFFLAFTGNLSAAAKLFEKNLPNAAIMTCPAWQFDFARTAIFLFDLLADAQNAPPPTPSMWQKTFGWLTGDSEKNKQSRVLFPKSYSLPEDVDSKDPAVVRDHFATVANELADAFDARSGNKRFSRRLNELADLKKQMTPYPV